MNYRGLCNGATMLHIDVPILEQPSMNRLTCEYIW
jgi:hypothetical protein